MVFLLLGFDSTVLLRDKGMLARIAAAAKQQKGRIVVIVGKADDKWRICINRV